MAVPYFSREDLRVVWHHARPSVRPSVIHTRALAARMFVRVHVGGRDSETERRIFIGRNSYVCHHFITFLHLLLAD